MKIFIIAAISIDGFIGRDSGHFPDWTSPEDTKFFVEKTKEAGVMVMGANTYQTLVEAGRTLPGRRSIVYTSDSSKFDAQTETTQLDPTDLIAQLEQQKVEQVAICGGSKIYGMFMEAGVVDDIYLTIEPVVFGEGIKLFDRKLDKSYRLLDTTKLNDNTIMLHYAKSDS
jgi:dihydrofolate reductase